MRLTHPPALVADKNSRKLIIPRLGTAMDVCSPWRGCTTRGDTISKNLQKDTLTGISTR